MSVTHKLDHVCIQWLVSTWAELTILHTSFQTSKASIKTIAPYSKKLDALLLVFKRGKTIALHKWRIKGHLIVSYHSGIAKNRQPIPAPRIKHALIYCNNGVHNSVWYLPYVSIHTQLVLWAKRVGYIRCFSITVLWTYKTSPDWREKQK